MTNKTKNSINALIVNVIDNKTSKVLIKDEVYNSKYSKYYKRSRKLLTDNNGLEVMAGFIVNISPTRPLSKNKSWKINEVIDRGSIVDSVRTDVEEIK